LRISAYLGWMEKLSVRPPGHCLDMGYIYTVFISSAAPTAFEYGRVGCILIYVIYLRINYDTFLLASYHHLGCHDTSKSRQRNVLRLVNLQHFNYELQRTSYERYFGRPRLSAIYLVVLSADFRSCFAQNTRRFSTLPNDLTTNRRTGIERLRSRPFTSILLASRFCLQNPGPILLPCSGKTSLIRIFCYTNGYASPLLLRLFSILRSQRTPTTFIPTSNHLPGLSLFFSGLRSPGIYLN
jgi:hypothetical protein